MRLLDITASAHRAGNRIDLTWTNPDPAGFPGVRVVRREGTHPRTPEDGVVVAHNTGLSSTSDSGLKGEAVYYYTLFPFSGNPPVYADDPHNRASAMATAPYDFAGRMYDLLPAIYRRYDAARVPAPGTGQADDQGKGQLRRYLDLVGYELDQLYSHARAALAFHDVDRVDARLLPLLAEWIGWRTNHGLPVSAQRNEVRFAPRVYQAVGAVPTLSATVARVAGWPSRTKEFAFNVARTNEPERLNLWSALRDTGGAWGTHALASTNFVHAGRPTAVREVDGSTLVLYHTHRRHGWDIWAKRFATGQWQPSEPVVDRPGIDMHPSAARQDNRLWLFWQSYDPAAPPAERRWRIVLRTRSGGTWSPVEVFGDQVTERRSPAAVADNTGGVWLFWLEAAAGGGWQVRYNRHDGTGWQLGTPGTMPPDGGRSPRVEEDLVAFFHPSSTSQRLWLFWVRQDPAGPAGQTRGTIAYRIKAGLDPAAADWSPVRTMPRDAAAHDREPAVVPGAGGNLEIFWASTRRGGWSVFRNTLNAGTFAWGTAEAVTTGAHTERAPLAADTGAGTLLVYRSNASLPYTSATYGAARTLDHRYAGTTTVDTTATAKLALRGQFEDFLTYTYDAGAGGVRDNDDQVARDTVGLYLDPDTADPDEVRAVVSRLASVLSDVMPASTRPVFITP